MAQPDYVPLQTNDRVRRDEKMPAAVGWRSDRPGDLAGPMLPAGPRLGRPGPDSGYGLKLMRRLAEKLRLTEGISTDDAVTGLFAVGSKRAALFGRAPILQDFEHAATIWGFLGQAPADLVAARRPLFSGCSHSYWDQRDICDKVPDDTLRLSLAQAQAKASDWKTLLAS